MRNHTSAFDHESAPLCWNVGGPAKSLNAFNPDFLPFADTVTPDFKNELNYSTELNVNTWNEALNTYNFTVAPVVFENVRTDEQLRLITKGYLECHSFDP